MYDADKCRAAVLAAQRSMDFAREVADDNFRTLPAIKVRVADEPDMRNNTMRAGCTFTVRAVRVSADCTSLAVRAHPIYGSTYTLTLKGDEWGVTGGLSDHGNPITTANLSVINEQCFTAANKLNAYGLNIPFEA